MLKITGKNYTEFISAEGDIRLLERRQVHYPESVSITSALAPGKQAYGKTDKDFERIEFNRKGTRYWLTITSTRFHKNRTNQSSLSIDKEHLGELIKKLTELHSQMM